MKNFLIVLGILVLTGLFGCWLLSCASAGIVLVTGGAADTTAPTPSPATFATPPYVISSTAIRMVATTGTDATGVRYYFACTAGGGNDSGWQTSEIYTDTGLTPSTEYTYTVQMRDTWTPTPNTGTVSSAASATTASETSYFVGPYGTGDEAGAISIWAAYW